MSVITIAFVLIIFVVGCLYSPKAQNKTEMIAVVCALEGAYLFGTEMVGL